MWSAVLAVELPRNSKTALTDSLAKRRSPKVRTIYCRRRRRNPRSGKPILAMNKLFLAILLSVLAFVADAVSQTTSARLEALLRPNPERDARDRAAATAEAAWIKRVFVDPFRARVGDASWGPRATAFVDRGAALWNDPHRLGDIDSYKGLSPLGDEAEWLVKSGCADPLVMYFSALALYGRDAADPQIMVAYERARKVYDDPAASNALKRFVRRFKIMYTARTERKGSSSDAAKDAELLKAAWQKGDDYRLDELPIFVEHETSSYNGNLRMYPDEYDKVFKTLGLPEWAQLTLGGTVEVNRGWKARGGGYADTVTDEGWKKLASHLANGRELLVKAWTLNKNEPWAANMMMSVVLGSGGGENETMFDWFERSVTARFNQSSAYSHLLGSVQPRWGGSYEQGMALGRAFLATKRFDTNVPLKYLNADNYLPDDGDPAERYAEPATAKEMVQLYEGLRDEPTRREEKEIWAGWLATFHWLARDYDKAGKAYLDVKTGLNPAVMRKLKLRKLEPAQVEGEIALASVKQFERYQKAVATLEKGKPGEALTQIAAIEKIAGSKPNAALAAVRKAAEFERDIATGKPVPVRFDDALAGWTRRLGNWTADGGALLCKGSDYSASILAPGRAGGRFTVRGKVDIKCTDDCCRQFMIFPGMKLPLAMAYGAYQKDKGPQSLAIHSDGREIPVTEAKATMLEKNTFVFRVDGAKISMELNGSPVVKDHDASEIEAIAVGGRWGFYMPRACRKNSWKIYDVEVQQLK
jgi:hypothetical protein